MPTLVTMLDGCVFFLCVFDFWTAWVMRSTDGGVFGVGTREVEMAMFLHVHPCVLSTADAGLDVKP